jgi:hypothetical protein
MTASQPPTSEAAPGEVFIKIYPPDTEYVGNLWCDMPSEGTSFIRATELDPPLLCFKSLEQILYKADQELEKVAQFCGAQVVPHEWGLIPGARKGYRQAQQLGDNLLVAKVDRIEPVKPRPVIGLVPQVWRGLDRYNRYARIRRYGLTNINSGQFMYGTNTNSGEGSTKQDPNYYLVDIEPFFRVVAGDCA